MTELFLFIVVGGLAVAFAALMLLSENAVHSALFLIGTMVCIAFLFLLLNAPFLAMIQISVYAGAIMVLFLFVIMLLGAEKILPGEPSEGSHPRRLFTRLAIVLGASLLFAIGVPLLLAQIDTAAVPGPQPMLRVANAQVGDQFVNVELIGEGETRIPLTTELSRGEVTDFAELPPGEYAVEVTYGNPTATGEIVPSQTLETALVPGTAQTLVIHGDETPALSLVSDDLSTVTADRSARFSLFNATTAPVSLVDFGAEFVEDDTRVLIADVPPGQQSTSFTRLEGEADWSVVPAADLETALVNVADLEIERNTNTTFIVTNERSSVDGSLLPVVLPLADRARSSFGGPEAIGYQLFTEYLLPFQLLALLLLAAMVGVIVLTHREFAKERRQVGGRRRVSRPLANVIAAQVGQDITTPDNGDGQPQLPTPERPETVGK